MSSKQPAVVDVLQERNHHYTNVVIVCCIYDKIYIPSFYPKNFIWINDSLGQFFWSGGSVDLAKTGIIMNSILIENQDICNPGCQEVQTCLSIFQQHGELNDNFIKSGFCSDHSRFWTLQKPLKLSAWGTRYLQSCQTLQKHSQCCYSHQDRQQKIFTVRVLIILKLAFF